VLPVCSGRERQFGFAIVLPLSPSNLPTKCHTCMSVAGISLGERFSSSSYEARLARGFSVGNIFAHGPCRLRAWSILHKKSVFVEALTSLHRVSDKHAPTGQRPALLQLKIDLP
jgi:hypothetical protein